MLQTGGQQRTAAVTAQSGSPQPGWERSSSRPARPARPACPPQAMAGVPSTVTLNTAWSIKAQAAALMFAANKMLSHDPPVRVCLQAARRQPPGLRAS